MNKFFFAILGGSLIIFGAGICFDPVFYDSRHGVTIDLTGFNVPIGLFTIVVGILLIWSIFKKGKKDSSAP